MRCRRGRSRGWAVVCASYGRGVRLGLFAINCNTCADPESCVRVARAAEAAGFDSVWTGENLVLPDPRTPMSPVPGAGADAGHRRGRHVGGCAHVQDPDRHHDAPVASCVVSAYGRLGLAREGRCDVESRVRRRWQ